MTRFIAVLYLTFILFSSPLFAQIPVCLTDLHLGPFKLGDRYNEKIAERSFGRIKDTIEHNKGKNRVIKQIIFEKGDLFIWNEKIVVITIKDDTYQTYKNLKVGDDLEKAKRLYGEPIKTEQTEDCLTRYFFGTRDYALIIKIGQEGKIISISAGIKI